jgi:hypothetical protein
VFVVFTRHPHLHHSFHHRGIHAHVMVVAGMSTMVMIVVMPMLVIVTVIMIVFVLGEGRCVRQGCVDPNGEKCASKCACHSDALSEEKWNWISHIASRVLSGMIPVNWMLYNDRT